MFILFEISVIVFPKSCDRYKFPNAPFPVALLLPKTIYLPLTDMVEQPQFSVRVALLEFNDVLFVFLLKTIPFNQNLAKLFEKSRGCAFEYSNVSSIKVYGFNGPRKFVVPRTSTL